MDDRIADQQKFTPKMTLKIKQNGEEKQEEGRLFTEATFISAE